MSDAMAAGIAFILFGIFAALCFIWGAVMTGSEKIADAIDRAVRTRSDSK
jgi:hypothetical protein